MLTVTQAALMLGVQPNLIYRLCSARKIRYCRVGVGRGVLRIPPEAVDEYLAGATIAVGEAAPPPKPSPAAPQPAVTSKYFRL